MLINRQLFHRRHEHQAHNLLPVSFIKVVGEIQPYILLSLEEALIALEYTEDAILLRENIHNFLFFFFLNEHFNQSSDS